MPNNRRPSRSAPLLGALLAAATGPIALFASQDPGAPPSGTPGAPSVLVLGGRSPSSKAEDVPTSPAEAAIDEAIAKLEATESLSAEIAMDVDLLGQQFEVGGSYLKAPGNRMLLRLDVKGLGDVSATVQQVSDGTTVYNYQETLGSRQISSFRLQAMLDVLDRPAVAADFRSLVLNSLGFGGPEALLRGFRKAATFDQMEEGERDGVPVLIVRGRWTDLAALGLPGAQPSPGATPDAIGPTFLPGYVPKRIALTIGKDDGWPYEVQMRGEAPSILLDTRQMGPDGRPIGRKSTAANNDPTDMTLVYKKSPTEVTTDDFLFQPPPGVEVQDVTESTVAALEAQVEQSAAFRGSSTLNGGDDPQGQGELLDVPISAPRPTGGEPSSGTTPAPAPDPAPSGGTSRSSIPSPG